MGVAADLAAVPGADASDAALFIGDSRDLRVPAGIAKFAGGEAFASHVMVADAVLLNRPQALHIGTRLIESGCFQRGRALLVRFRIGFNQDNCFAGVCFRINAEVGDRASELAADGKTWDGRDGRVCGKREDGWPRDRSGGVVPASKGASRAGRWL